jgi:hypothetical protein
MILAPGKYTLRVDAPGYSTYEKTITIKPDEKKNLGMIQLQPGIKKSKSRTTQDTSEIKDIFTTYFDDLVRKTSQAPRWQFAWTMGISVSGGSQMEFSTNFWNAADFSIERKVLKGLSGVRIGSGYGVTWEQQPYSSRYSNYSSWTEQANHLFHIDFTMPFYFFKSRGWSLAVGPQISYRFKSYSRLGLNHAVSIAPVFELQLLRPSTDPNINFYSGFVLSISVPVHIQPAHITFVNTAGPCINFGLLIGK